jgi:DNA-binding NarL/FixJ family response regulator
MPPPKTEVKKSRVLLVEDHPMFRERLSYLINKDLEMTVCGEADNIQTAMAFSQESPPDIAIVDITLRGSSGLELIKDYKAQGMKIPVLVLSMHDETLYAERALRAGAKGYITKNEASSEVMVAIRKVLQGEIYLSSRMTSRVIERLADTGRVAKTSEMGSLTDRELEVFQLVGHGKNTHEIAAQLRLGESTVDTYRARIKDKLRLKNVAELYHRATEWVKEQETNAATGEGA